MAKYQVQMDVTFSTTVEVDASSESQAELMASTLINVPSDLRSHNYWHLGTDIVDIEKVED